jgi:hypothetical protein
VDGCSVYRELQLKKAFLLCVISASLSGIVSAQTPSIVQYASDMQFTFEMASGQYMLSYLPNSAGAGNLITVCYGADESGLPTVSDDKGNTYHLGGTIRDTDNNKDVTCYYAYNVIAGTRVIKVTAQGATNWSTPLIAEWTNVLATADPLDKSHGAFGPSSTIAAGSITPSYSGDLVVQFAWNAYACCGTPGITWTAGSQANITWALWAAENELAAGAQWGVYNSTSPLNATMSDAGSIVGGASVAMFFRAASAGTPQPKGIQVVGRKTININVSAPYNANPHTIQAPCPAYSNLMVIDYASGGADLTGVSSYPSNTWVQTHALVGTGTPKLHNYYAANATLSPTTTVTLTFDSVNAESAEIYCIKGAATAPFDVAAVNSTGNQTSCPGGNCNLNLVTVTPTTTNGLIIVDGSQEQNTSTLFVRTNQLWDGCLYSNESLSVSGCSQNNPFGHYLNPDTSSVNFTATQLSNSTPVQGYVAEADSYKSGIQSTAPNPPTGLAASVQ